MCECQQVHENDYSSVQCSLLSLLYRTQTCVSADSLCVALAEWQVLQVGVLEWCQVTVTTAIQLQQSVRGR